MYENNIWSIFPWFFLESYCIAMKKRFYQYVVKHYFTFFFLFTCRNWRCSTFLPCFVRLCFCKCMNFSDIKTWKPFLKLYFLFLANRQLKGHRWIGRMILFGIVLWLDKNCKHDINALPHIQWISPMEYIFHIPHFSWREIVNVAQISHKVFKITVYLRREKESGRIRGMLA